MIMFAYEEFFGGFNTRCGLGTNEAAKLIIDTLTANGFTITPPKKFTHVAQQDPRYCVENALRALPRASKNPSNRLVISVGSHIADMFVYPHLEKDLQTYMKNIGLGIRPNPKPKKRLI